MTHKQLYRRISNLDRLYIEWDRFEREAMAHPHDSEERRGLLKVAKTFRKRYDRLVADRRRVSA